MVIGNIVGLQVRIVVKALVNSSEIYRVLMTTCSSVASFLINADKKHATDALHCM